MRCDTHILSLFGRALLLLIGFLTLDAAAQSRLGLVLSGGGAKGFAHIGVLKVLEEKGVHPDFITGTSMGAIIGALYAIGYSALEIEEIVLNTDWSDLFNDEVHRKSLVMGQKQWDGRYFGSLPIRERRIQLPSGLIPGQKISKLLSRLTINVHHIDDFSQFRIPFACVATDITNGRSVVLDHGFLPEALRASMAIPSIFSPIRIDGRLLVDGGLARNLPAQDVRALGAEYVIAVDVSSLLQKEEELNSFLNILAQTINLMMEPATAEQRKLCDLVIAPDMQEISILSFGQAEEAIAIGEAAAHAALDQLPDSISSNGNYSRADLFTRGDSILINAISVDGLKKVSRELVFAELEMTIPARYTLDDLEASTQKVYSCQFFERVTYKIVPDSAGSKLIVKVAEKSDDSFRFGLRYNTSTEASVILNANFRNLAQNNSFLNLDLLLGQQILVDANLLYHTGTRPGVGLSSRLTYNDIFMDVFDAGKRRARLSVKTYSTEHLFGNFFATRASFSVGLRLERTIANIRIAASDSLAFSHKAFGFVGVFSLDTFDRANYPTSGVRLDLRNDVVPGGFGDNDRFSRHFLDFSSALKLGRHYVLTNQIVLGTTTGERMPLHNNFILGGVDAPLLLLNNHTNTASFAGLKYQERVGEHIQYLQLGLQIEVLRRTFITLKTNAGNTFGDWNWNLSPGKYEKGLGVSAGVLTPVGPIELTLMTGSHDLLTYLNVGFRF